MTTVNNSRGSTSSSRWATTWVCQHQVKFLCPCQSETVRVLLVWASTWTVQETQTTESTQAFRPRVRQLPVLCQSPMPQSRLDTLVFLPFTLRLRLSTLDPCCSVTMCAWFVGHQCNTNHTRCSIHLDPEQSGSNDQVRISWGS